MKTGEFAYWDGTIDAKFDKKRPLKGIVVVEDDYHAFLVLPKDVKNVDWWDGKRKCEEQFAQMPNLRQLEAICNNKEILNKAFIAAGGEALDDEAYYWSSTEFSGTGAWRLGMSDGYRFSYTKYSSGNGCVRPVLAF